MAYPQSALELAAGITPTDTDFIWGDVRRYGAVIDGTTDDTSAIQTAVDSGHEVYVPEGTYNVRGTIVADGNKTIRMTAATTLERQDGLSTAPMLHCYGERNTVLGNGATIRQDLYSHPKGIVLIGQDPGEAFGGGTDVNTDQNHVENLKIVGPVKNIAQDGSPGFYIHSLRRRMFGSSSADRRRTYYCSGHNVNIVNCDVGLEFSSDANAHHLSGFFIHQWKEAAIVMNASYGNKLTGFRLESPLAVSSTRRFALHLLAQNGSSIEGDTSASYGIDAAFKNNIETYAELPNDSGANSVVSLLTFTETGSAFGGNQISGQHTLGAGVGKDGTTTPAGLGTNVYRGHITDARYVGPSKVFGRELRELDDGSNSGPLDVENSVARLSGRKAGIAEGASVDIFKIENIGPTRACIQLKLSLAAKSNKSNIVNTNFLIYHIEIIPTNQISATKVFDAPYNGGVGRQDAVTVSIAVSASGGKGTATVSLVGESVAGTTAQHYCSWFAEIISSELAGTNFTARNDITYL